MRDVTRTRGREPLGVTDERMLSCCAAGVGEWVSEGGRVHDCMHLAGG